MNYRLIPLLVMISCSTCRKNYVDCLICDCSNLIKPKILAFSDTLQVWIPNSFTPNGDGRNDLFGPTFDSKKAKVWQFDIYSRHKAKLIFRTNNLIQDYQKWYWDGNNENGKPLGDRIFFYRLKGETNTGEPFHYEGEVYKNSATCLEGPHLNKCFYPDQVVPSQGFVLPTGENICRD